MMLDYFFTLLPIGIALIIGAYTVWMLSERTHQRPTAYIDLPEGISVKDIGIIERDLANLRRVMVIADKVRRPESELLEAVEHNFARGVKYLFLVSEAHAQEELDGYFKLFEDLAKIVLRRPGCPYKNLEDMIQIKRLPYDWDDFPLIFYQVQLPSQEIKTLAFRGDQLHEGIAKHYGRVEPAYAHTIARAILEDAPENVPVVEMSRKQFEVVNTDIFKSEPSAKAIN